MIGAYCLNLEDQSRLLDVALLEIVGGPKYSDSTKISLIRIFLAGGPTSTFVYFWAVQLACPGICRTCHLLPTSQGSFPCKVDFGLVTKNSVERSVFSVIQLGGILFCWSV